MLKTERKVSVLGVGISAVSYDDVVAQVDSWHAARRTGGEGTLGRYICVTSVHGVMTAQKDPSFREILNDADIVTPDGMPIVWALRSFGEGGQTRVYGPTLMLKLCEQAARRGMRLFLFGGRPEVLPELERNLCARFPGLIIAGSYSPPFRPVTDAEEQDIQRRIRAADADLIFVGISTPKQERWMQQHRGCFPGAVMIGVGAAFDFHGGRVSQAPAWMQRNGLEWFFRLLSEPRRLWRRYLLETPGFLPYWMLQKAGLLRYELPAKPVATAGGR